MAHDWRDLFSTKFLHDHFMSQVHTSCGMNSPERIICWGLTCDIDQYHRIEKSDYGKLESRRKRLKRIAQKAGVFIRFWYTSEDKMRRDPSKGRNVVPGQEVDYTAQDIPRLLLSIKRRALRKAAYLKMLKSYYTSRKARSIDMLKSLISRPHALNEDLVSLSHGVRPEQVDFMHRTIEFREEIEYQLGAADGKGDAKGKLIILQRNPEGELVKINADLDGEASEYARAFAEWFNEDINTPFFLWLENHTVCLGDSKHSNNGVHKVNYSDLSRKGALTPIASLVMVCHIGAFNQVWCGYPGMRVADFRVCDTGRYSSPGKAPPGWAAFVFSEHYELFIAKHEANVWHHSSFMAGNPVRCAGMIKVVKGKVAGITGSSGHYKPGARHVYNFCNYLDQKGVLDSACTIECRNPDYKGTWSDFKQKDLHKKT